MKESFNYWIGYLTLPIICILGLSSILLQFFSLYDVGELLLTLWICIFIVSMMFYTDEWLKGANVFLKDK